MLPDKRRYDHALEVRDGDLRKERIGQTGEENVRERSIVESPSRDIAVFVDVCGESRSDKVRESSRSSEGCTFVVLLEDPASSTLLHCLNRLTFWRH